MKMGPLEIESVTLGNGARAWNIQHSPAHVVGQVLRLGNDAEAYAALFAAAPDLLAMLEEARGELRLIRSKDGAVYDPTLLARMDILITKATPPAGGKGAGSQP